MTSGLRVRNTFGLPQRCGSLSPECLEALDTRNRNGDASAGRNRFVESGLDATAQGLNTMPESVLDAIRQGIWDYEPPQLDGRSYGSTQAIPGSDEKLEILAERLRRGLPLWHPSDRNHRLNTIEED